MAKIPTCQAQKCKKTIRATANSSSWHPQKLVPLQKTKKLLWPSWRRRRRRRRRRARVWPPKRKALSSLASDPTKTAAKEAPQGAKISCGTQTAPHEADHFQNAPALGDPRAQIWFCFQPPAAALGKIWKRSREDGLLPPPTSTLQQILPQFA